MLNYDDLKKFITETMKMSHLYQPVIIKTLLQSNGASSKTELAQKMHAYLPIYSVNEYKKKLGIYPKEVLTSHGILTADGDLFRLSLDLELLNINQTKELIQLCEDKIQNYLKQESETAQFHRKINWQRIQDRSPVLKAISEFDQLGREAFLEKYSCSPSTKFFLLFEEKVYDIKALAAASWSFAFPNENLLTCSEFSSGAPLLRFFKNLGFRLVQDINPEKQTESNFIVGNQYTREDIYEMLEIPIQRQRGDWLNGYHREGTDWFVFVNLGQPGRTGHDYANYWDNKQLVWQAKIGSKIDHPSIQSLLNPDGNIHIFTRERDRDPFTFQGLAQAVSHENTSPVTIRWQLLENNFKYKSSSVEPISFQIGLAQLSKVIQQTGFHYESWQIANFITALKTKPFVILAGLSGTGKSKLPTLVGELTEAKVELIAVRPDWSDSSDLIGYQNLQDTYVKGQLLELAKQAQIEPERMHICILDEMNLARVEQYFAEVLSLIEDRRLKDNGYSSQYPLTKHAAEIFFPANLLIVGTVNMDETTHGFSKKVLDRAFTIEMSEFDLGHWHSTSSQSPESAFWPRSFWKPKGLRLGDLRDLAPEEELLIENTIKLLNIINNYLTPAQLQVGYRVRDEVCLYLLHARELSEHFIGKNNEPVDPMDLALLMKILPRIQGSSMAIREVLRNLLSWSTNSKQEQIEDDLEQWKRSGRPQVLATARFPRTAARLMMMYERYLSEGFTSYWL